MNNETCVKLLESHGIKATANRIVIVREIALSRNPLTLSELESRILSIDKSGIFRAMTLFREHHLVHAIDDGEGGALRYELCHSHSDSEDDDLHVHFHCEQCQRTFCLDGVSVPDVEVPPGFMPMTASHIVKGICPDCNHK